MKWAFRRPQPRLNKKLAIYTSIFVLGLSGTLGLLARNASTVEAAGTATWVTGQSLSYNGDTYSSSNIATAFVGSQRNSNNCQQRIVFNNTNFASETTAKLQVQNYDPVQHTCTSWSNGTAIQVNAQSYNGGAGSGNPAGTGNGQNGQNGQSIDVNCGPVINIAINPLNWFLCPLAEGMSHAAIALDGQITDWLCVNQQDIFGQGDSCGQKASDNSKKTSAAYHAAWNVFRLLAVGLLIIGGLIMILSQAAGLEIFDAYTVRKVLPRLIIAAIAITLSWQLLSFFVGLTNDLGVGVRGLIYAPFLNSGLDNNLAIGHFGESMVAGLVGLGLFVSLGALGLVSFLATALLAIFIAFLVIVIRNILIVLLLVLAPVAIAAYVLPNTQKIYQTWWDWFSKALLVFPIITAFIAAGRVFAAVSYTEGGTINQLIAFIAYFAPYFLLPFAFRLAGGALGTIGGLVNDRSRGGFDRLRNFRKNQAQQNWQNIKSGNRFAGGTSTNFRGKLNRGLQYGTLLPESRFNPRRAKARMQVAKSDRVFDEAMEGLEKGPAMRAIAPNDSALDAGLASGGDEQKLRQHFRHHFHDEFQKRVDSGDMTQAEADKQANQSAERETASVMAAIREQGWDRFEVAATIAKAGTKTGYAAEYDEKTGQMIRGGNTQLYEAIKKASGGNEVLAGRMLGAAKGTAGRAGRDDLGASFGKSLTQLQSVMRGGHVDEQHLLLDVFENKDAVSLGRGDSRSVRAVATAAQTRINELSKRTQPGAVGGPLNEAEQRELGELTGALESWKASGMYMAPQRIATVEKAVQNTHTARNEVHIIHEQNPETQHPLGNDISNQTAQGYREQTAPHVRMQQVPSSATMTTEEARARSDREMMEETLRRARGEGDQDQH